MNCSVAVWCFRKRQERGDADAFVCTRPLVSRDPASYVEQAIMCTKSFTARVTSVDSTCDDNICNKTASTAWKRAASALLALAAEMIEEGATRGRECERGGTRSQNESVHSRPSKLPPIALPSRALLAGLSPLSLT